jgi:hypothetical protein
LQGVSKFVIASGFMKTVFQTTDTIISKRNKLTLFKVLVAFFLCVFLVSRFVRLYLLRFSTSKAGSDTYILLITIIIFSLGGVYTLVHYITNTRTIKLDKNSLTIGKKTIPWSDVETITLNGEHRSLFNKPGEEAVIFYLRNGKVKYVYAIMYSNISQLKMFISQIVLEEAPANQIVYQQPDQVDIDGEVFSTYKDYQLLSIQGLVMWFAVPLFLSGILLNWSEPAILRRLMLLGFLCLWIFLPSQSMSYFKVSPRFLIIKKQNIPWVQQVYQLTN